MSDELKKLVRDVVQEQYDDIVILEIKPTIRNDEQYFRVKFENNWLNGGYDKTMVSLTEILSYLYSKIGDQSC